MFLSSEKFILLIILAAGIPVVLVCFISYVLYRQNTLRKQQQFEIVSAMLATQESERKRIAEDLHDHLGPFLTGIKYTLSSDDSHETFEGDGIKIIKAKSELDSAIKEVRLIAHELYAGNIAEIGLAASLIEAVEKFSRHNKEIKLDISIDSELSIPFQVNVYRIALELIHNSIKHSNGKSIMLSIIEIKQTIYFDYTDSGNSRKQISGKGIGLESIKNRVALCKGTTCFFSTSFEQGAKFSFIFPV